MSGADYKVEAATIVAIALSSGYQNFTAEGLLALAQVNAIIYAAENQHIANLLAYQALHPNSHTDLDNSVADQITEAMGA